MFQVKDLTKVLESLPEDDNTILIGGQALNVWAEYYSELDAALTTHSPFFSNDIDFLGDKQAATALHDAWKGTIKIPDMDTHTAMTAKLTFKLEDGRPVNVDFLEVMIGVDNYHIEPLRVFRRLHFLRGWSNEQSQMLSPRDPGTGRAPCP